MPTLDSERQGKQREFRAAARSARRRYVRDAERGLARRRRGKSFTYVRPNGETLRDRQAIGRIQSLAIPPAWKDVWICPTPDGHPQATGRDARGRKQHRYHPRWREAQDKHKYERVLAFAKALPRIRHAVARDLRKRGLPRENVLAATIKPLETTLVNDYLNMERMEQELRASNPRTRKRRAPNTKTRRGTASKMK